MFQEEITHVAIIIQQRHVRIVSIQAVSDEQLSLSGHRRQIVQSYRLIRWGMGVFHLSCHIHQSPRLTAYPEDFDECEATAAIWVKVCSVKSKNTEHTLSMTHYRVERRETAPTGMNLINAPGYESHERFASFKEV